MFENAKISPKFVPLNYELFLSPFIVDGSGPDFVCEFVSSKKNFLLFISYCCKNDRLHTKLFQINRKIHVKGCFSLNKCSFFTIYYSS